MAEPKKKPTESTSAATTGPSAREKAAREGSSTVEDVTRARAREAELQATGSARLQESEGNKGAYGGLGLADRSRAERMVRSGEAKTRDEAAAKIKSEKQPKRPPAAVQAQALSK
jgi:hypothetical protein